MDEAEAILDADLDNFIVWASVEIHLSCKVCDYRVSFGDGNNLWLIVQAARTHDCDEFRAGLEEAHSRREARRMERERLEGQRPEVWTPEGPPAKPEPKPRKHETTWGEDGRTPVGNRRTHEERSNSTSDVRGSFN